MDIRELRYFSAVFAERNLTAAARRCFISQPSISAAITNLEAELGTTLFIRHKKGVAPTRSAEQFHSVARRIIDDADAARNLFRTPSARHALTLGLMRTLDMPRTIALLKPLTSASDVALRLVGIHEAADARIISKSMIDADEHFIPLWTDRYVAALPPSHPLTLKDKLRTSDFAGVAMIGRCRRWHCDRSGRRGARQSRCGCARDRSRGETPGRTCLQRGAACLGRAAKFHCETWEAAAEPEPRQAGGQDQAIGFTERGSNRERSPRAL